MDTFFNLVTLVAIVIGIQYVSKISKELGHIMNGITALRDAVNNQTTTFANALAAMEAALTELAEDIRGLAAKEDIEAEAERIAANTESLGTALGGFAQRIHDAVPTAPAEEPLPPVETPVEEPAEDPLPTEEPPPVEEPEPVEEP